MYDAIGSLEIREHSPVRVVLGLSRSTQATGGALVALGLFLAAYAMPISPWLTLVPALVGLLGAVLLTLRRELVVDREDGTLRLNQRAFGVGSETVVPLFHLRAVVIVARTFRFGDGRALFSGSPRYVAYLDRRVGDAIYLDESRRCVRLLRLAEAIAEVAEVRLEYEAPSGAEA